MVAASRLRKRENVFQPEVRGEKLPPLLKVVAVYGPNASGKSNLIKALGTVGMICRRHPSTQVERLPVSPFRFDAALQDKPSQFELHFVQEGMRYSFELAATADRIFSERLVAYPKGKEELLYQREYRDKQEEYVFGDYMEGGRDLHEAWRKLTSPQALFVSQAVANSSEELTQLRGPFKWLSEGALFVDNGMKRFASMTQRFVAEFSDFGGEVAKLLHDVDVPISEISVKVIDNDLDAVKPEKISDKKESAKDRLLAFRPDVKVRTTLKHETSLGSADFDFDEESEGTRNIFGFALPWLLLRAEKIENRRILVVDELDSSLHPKVVEALIERQINASVPCQLIFTTHDTHLMDTRLLRRDQFWLTERDSTGATQLRSIHDFEGREGEDVEKRYYEGRYRGLPLVRKGRA